MAKLRELYLQRVGNPATNPLRGDEFLALINAGGHGSARSSCDSTQQTLVGSQTDSLLDGLEFPDPPNFPISSATLIIE